MTRHIETRVIHDFLSEEDYAYYRKKLLYDMNDAEEQEMLGEKPLLWRTSKIVSDKDWHEDEVNTRDNFQMVSQFLLEENRDSINLQPFLEAINPLFFARIKANITFRGDKILEHGMHVDVGHRDRNIAPDQDYLAHIPIATGVYILDTCDGYTAFEDGTKIPSVGNTYIEFDRTMKHTGTNTTNQNKRCVINFNYMPKPRFPGAGEDVFRFPCDPLADLGFDPAFSSGLLGE